MAVLKNYSELAGRHMETGTVRNALAYQGVKAPHTGKPASEALLLGVSGRAAFGYFTCFHFSLEGIRVEARQCQENALGPSK